MKPISFSCSGCGTRLTASRPNLLGKKICCPKCETTCRVPAGPPRALAVAARKGPAWPGPRGVRKAAPQARKRALTAPGVLAALLLIAYPWLVAATYCDLLIDPSAYRLQPGALPTAEKAAGPEGDVAAPREPAQGILMSRP